MTLADRVVKVTGYQFKNETLLHEALTAAGVNGDNHDGNKELAQVKKAFIKYYSLKLGYLFKASPYLSTLLKSQAAMNRRCAIIVKCLGLDELITYSPLPGAQSPRVLNKAMNALLGAVNIDSRSENATVGVLEQIGWFSYPMYYPDRPTTTEAVSQKQNDILPSGSLRAVHKECDRTSFEEARHVKHSWTPYLQIEEQRCLYHSMPSPREAYFPPEVEKELVELQEKNPRVNVDFGLLYLMFAGSQSIVGLRTVFVGALAAADPRINLHCKSVSLRERVAVIQILEEKNCHLYLLKDFHILQLFRDAAKSSVRCLHQTRWRSPQNNGRPGNPINLEGTDITKSMMKHIFPELEESSSAYSSSFNKLKLWRRKGRRLDLLVEKFSIGILGLIYNTGLSCHGPTLSTLLSSKVADRIFDHFVAVLEKNQGWIIKDVCHAISHVVDHLICGTFHQLKSGWMSSVAVEETLQCPKGSPSLLQLLKRNGFDSVAQIEH